MPIVKLPQAGKNIQSGTVRRWLVGPGGRVNKGDALVELDTEEGLLVVEAPVSGQVGQIMVPQGRTADVHGPLATIEEITPAEASAVSASTSGSVSSQADGPAKGAGIQTGGCVIPVLMPKAGQSMEEGTIVQWRVQVGQQISKGQVIFEIETDKATMEVEATDSGRLARIVVPEGGVLPVLQPVAYLADTDADVDAFLAQAGGQSQTRDEGMAGNASAAATAAAGPKPADLQGPRNSVLANSPATAPGGQVKASPAARKIAGQRGVDLASVGTGSGPRGRILSTDVPATGTAAGPKRRKMSSMRKAIARNLLASKQTIPHFYVRLTIDAGPMVAYYQEQKTQFPCSLNDVVVKACARAIAEFPALRSRVEEDEIVEIPHANIGIAVGMDDGLVVPVLLKAEQMSLQQIGSESKRIASAARGGKIEGMGQGCFTITNLGMFGTEEFAAIINPPEAAILAVGAAREAVVVKDGAMRAGKVMTMTLSADHRVVDGMLAAKFVARIRELLENPTLLA